MKGIDIKKRRAELGLTQDELAKLLGVNRNTIYNYEKGGEIPASKSTILDKILFNNNVTDIKEVIVNVNEETALIINKQLTLLEKVNSFVKNLETIKNPSLIDLQQLNEAILLKAKIQLELNKLKE